MRVSAGRATRLALPAFLQVYLFFTGMYFFTGMSTYSIIVSSQDRIRCTDGNFCAVTGGEGEHKFGIATWMEPRHISRTDCSMSKETEMQILPENTKTMRDLHSR